MNIVMIIPTGIDCAIGGHAGDATPAAKLLASVCDKLILHPNVVNASDINEMPDNALYVEGSILDKFLEGQIELQEVKQNKVLLVVNSPTQSHTINAVSAARATIGMDVEIVELERPLILTVGWNDDGSASGRVEGFQSLIEQVQKYEFDALAIVTPITVSKSVMMSYFKEGGINPIGGVEALASRLIADKLNKPVAHAPFEEWRSELWEYNEVVNPCMAAEMISCCYLHCILKGLHKAPRISQYRTGYGMGLSVKDIDIMVSPYGCWGRPHGACEQVGIPIIVVRENKCCLSKVKPSASIYVENYLEAAGMIAAMSIGISPASVQRPLEQTKVVKKD